MKCEACGKEIDSSWRFFCNKCGKTYRLCDSCDTKWYAEDQVICPSCRGAQTKKEEVMETTALETVLKKIEDVEIGDEVVTTPGGSCYIIKKVKAVKEAKFANDRGREPKSGIILGDGFDMITSAVPGEYVMVVKK